jgi:hypothetical protein
VHEGHQPDLLGDLSDSDILPGERTTQVDLAPTDAQPAAARHHDDAILQGIVELA